MGMETIPKETTPFHIDRGMTRVYLVSPDRRLLLVGTTTLSADVAPLDHPGRRYKAHDHDEQHDRERGAVDSRAQRLPVQVERGNVLHPARPVEDRRELHDEVAHEGEAAEESGGCSRQDGDQDGADRGEEHRHRY